MQGGNLNFMDFAILEPKCPSCGTKIDYGKSTRFDEKKEAHVCISCGFVLK